MLWGATAGKRRPIDDLRLANRRIANMPDDPYQSPAAFVRRAGAYRKPERAYGNFVWSDFLRMHVPMTGIGAGPFSLALLRAIKVSACVMPLDDADGCDGKHITCR